ncbi:DUF126 domain-containing protein [soil metagenome]
MNEDRAEGRTLVPGWASGAAIVLEEPLSFWGGFDPVTGAVVDPNHPQAGAVLTNRVLVLPSGRGSSSSSSVLAEAIRRGTGPRALILRHPDPILAVGAMVAAELYGRSCPVVVLGAEDHDALGEGVLEVEAGPHRAVVRTRS